MTGSKSNTTTTNSTATRTPYAPATGNLQQILTDSQSYYQNGSAAKVYDGQRVAGLGDTTQAGLAYLKDNASAGLGNAQSASGLVSDLMKTGGQTAGTKAAADAYSSIGSVDTGPTAGLASRMANPNGAAQQVGSRLAGGNTVTTEGDYRGLLGDVSGPSQTQKSLQATADGAFLGGANPQLEAMIQRTSAAAAARVNAQMAASGRYGSGMNQNAVADATSANELNLRYQDYENERARQASAASAIDSAANARMGLASGFIGNIGSAQAQNAGLAAQGAQLGLAGDAAALGAAGQLASQQATNAGLDATRASGLAGIASGDRAVGLASVSTLPGLENSLLAPGRTLAQAGAVQDAARQDQINAQMAQFDETQAAPWKNLALYQNSVMPIAGAGGSTTGTETKTTPQPSLLQQILGGVSSGVGLLGQTGAFSSGGSGGSPGYLTPMLTSLFTASDERVKENISQVGQLNDGQTVYSYNYKGDPRTQIGLVAQEVMQHDPEAVAEGPHGLMMVDYDKATRRARRA
ncbi:tail fiber domain-containing protein [Methylobacterium ajmalii]|uniref:Tail fiber domain-containing protein n=1 Tax=Methylobacterium ajmalii TaxID=2738439 RepID=A0ABV0A6R6_9HYPH